MPQYNAPVKDHMFTLFEWLEIEQYKDVLPGFEDLSIVEPILDESARFCSEVLFPLNEVGDNEGLGFKDGEVTLPTGFKDAYQQYVQAGWAGMTCDANYGGQGLPHVIGMPLTEMICSSNLSFGLLPGLTHGAYSAIHLVGNDEQKEKYLPKMISGEWTGVMCLTEPQAGTDLGLIRTKATPNDDGSYNIEGNKIFISCGEHDGSDNIIHLVLARLPDAPPGVKGISLFLVPKIFVNDDGSLGERNAVKCERLEEKMGIHASPTCEMSYSGAKGWLVGEAHKGLKAMFIMMNEARIMVGIQGLGIAEIATQNALDYAKERLQGRNLKKPALPNKAADPITEHPDVRKMLLTMRTQTEGCRVLAAWTSLMLDIRHNHPDEKERERADDFVQLMTPIVKAYLTDAGTDVASVGMQVLGGYGYIKEYGMEQYLRDARICQIYEGTNGVQALDLVGRKLPMHTGRYLRSFCHPVYNFVQEHKDDPEMAEFTKPLYMGLKSLQQASLWIAANGLGNPNEAAGASVDYLRMFGHVALGYIWARTAWIATNKLKEDGADKEFYETKLASARFFLNKVLPEHYSLLAKISAGVKHLEMPDVKVS